MTNAAAFHRDIEKAAGELTEAIYEGKVVAVGIVYVCKGDGYARTIARCVDGARFPLLAAAAHLQHDILHMQEPENEPLQDGE
jgi:hypothetical protein